jgi:hypothetical protein
MTLGTSKRDFSINPDRAQRSLELFTGDMKDYTPKKEKVPLFTPMHDLTWVNGMPSHTSKLQNRYLPSNKNNNGNLPFEYNVRVKPGVKFQNQEGNYGVYRVDPRTVNELRSEINQKVSYMNKPLETGKMGEIRAPDFNLTKFKLPDFREQTVDDLVPTRAEISAGYNAGKFTNVVTNRNMKEDYNPGPATNSTRGEGPDITKTRFEGAKKESYLNDNTHSVNAIHNKPVMTNIESFTNYETQRASTSVMYEGPAGNSAYGNYTVDYNDVPLVTTRELMIHGNTKMGVNSTSEKAPYVFSNDMVLPVTNRQTMSTNNPILGTSSDYRATTTHNTDVAKKTIRQSTSHSEVTNATAQDKLAPVMLTDNMKPTIREFTSHSEVTNATSQDKSAPVMLTDSAKKTIREFTSHSDVTNVTSQDKSAPVMITDNMKPTIREFTSHSEVTNVTSQDKSAPTYYTDSAKKTIREFTSHNIITNTTSQDKSAPVLLTDKAKPTIREFTSHNMVTNAISQDKSAPTQYTDKAKPTVRQQTESTQYIGSAHNNEKEATYVRDMEDTARPTVRQQTELTQYIGSVHNNDKEATYVRDLEDTARPTIKQTTLAPTPGGRVGYSNGGNYMVDYEDVARPTVKETTLLEDYVGVAVMTGTSEHKISHIAANNMEINERREITTFNRPANGKADLHGPYIDKETVYLNEPLLYSFVPAPLKPLDSIIRVSDNRKKVHFDQELKPTLNAKSIVINNSHGSNRPTISNSSYYITNNRINTLKDNPLVNDLYHQKQGSF